MSQLEYIFTIERNEVLNYKTRLMTLLAPADAPADLIQKTGQFVNLEVEGHFLRRPISVCDWEPGRLTLLYDVVGDGTAIMSEWKPGKKVNVLAPLGNGFNLERSGQRPLLIGGGIGIAPLYWLAKELVKQGKEPVVVLGFNSKEELSWEDEFRNVTPEVYVATAAGDYGVKGFVTDVEAVRNAHEHSYYYACGPMPMLKALGQTIDIPGELSLDERMACGFGVCMCCSLRTKDGAKRICKDGPIFTTEELIWK
ncbi:MAG: dihydroorotate dehydrogenase electron transfer subunit [Muribaculaceae bacterium]|nr:dihydroorotate dehydrogenase electron transfer subunit [Muribaculaceae bacterium]